MLPRENRLLSDGDFKLVKEKGRIVKNPFFLMIILFREDKRPSRFGFIVSAKVSKRAIDRNKIKRLFRNSIKILLSQIKLGYDILFIAYKDCLYLKKEFLLKEVEKSLKVNKILV